MSRSRLFAALRNILGIGLAFALMAYVISTSGVDPKAIVESVDLRFLGLALGWYGLGLSLLALRWLLLLHHVNAPLTLRTVLKLTFIGLFFNLFVPGGVGGDLLKMVYLKDESGDRYPEALLTVLLDRILGLSALLILGVTALLWNWPVLKDSTAKVQAILLVVGLASIGGLGLILVFLAWPKLEPFFRSFSGWADRLPESVSSGLTRANGALGLLRSSPSKLLLILTTAGLGHVFATFGVMSIARGLGVAALEHFKEFLLATQVSNLIGAIPLTPGGLGGRDLCMSMLLEATGTPAELAGAIPVIVTAILIFWSTCGGPVWIWEKLRRSRRPSENSESEL